MILLINNRKIMGTYVNKVYQNIIGWGAVIVLTGLSIALLIIPFFSK
jgi:Mn2+/Fe2+ NRAMP family transporter